MVSRTIGTTLLSLILLEGCVPAGPPSQYPDELLLAISQDREAGIAAVLRAEPRLLDVALINGQSPLYYAVQNRKLNAVEALLSAGADPSLFSRGIASNTVDSPILLAVRSCDMDLVRRLLNSETSHFFTRQELSEAIAERKWQAGCSVELSTAIAEYIATFVVPL